MSERLDGKPRTYSGDYCGCCGNPCRGEFCLKCRPHIAPQLGSRLHAWERTYFAQHHTDCPFQAPAFKPREETAS